MKIDCIQIASVIFLLASFTIKVSAQKYDWHGFYDVESNEDAYILDIQLDNDGNVYTCGGFTKTDFDIGPGVSIKTADYGQDYFISKYDSLGNLIWTITRGQNYILDDYITDLVFDEQNNIYAIGYDDDNFHDDSKFILKLNSSGVIIWRKDFFRQKGQFQRAQVYFYDIKVDHQGDLVITGSISDTTDMDPGSGTQLYYPTGLYDLLLFKMNSQGEVLWVKTTGSNDAGINSSFFGYYLGIDTANHIWVSGYYSHKVDFDPGPGEFYFESPSQKNPYLAKYDDNGNFIWAKQATQFNVNYDNVGGKIFTRRTGEVYWTFPYEGEIYDPELFSDTLYSIFDYATPILKLNPDGSIDHVFKVASKAGINHYHIYPNGDILVIGDVEDTGDLDHSYEGVSIKTSTNSQSETPFMIRYDAEGKFLWSRKLQDGTNTGVGFMDADDEGNIYMASTFCCSMNLTGEEDNPIPSYPLSGSQSVTSFMMKYKNLDCTGLEVEYITPDDIYDQGVEPNMSNVPFWKSPSLYNTLRPGFYLKYNLDYDAFPYENYVHVTVQSEGCNTVSNSKVALYFSIGDEGLLAPGPWQAQYADIGGQISQISGKAGELEIPPLYKNETWQAAIHFVIPVDPELYPEKAYSINLFGRIESAFDPDATIPSQNILEEVMNNNNISWRVFQVRP